MKDRVKQLNGRFHIDKEQGFTILITILKEENASNRIECNNDHEQSYDRTKVMSQVRSIWRMQEWSIL